VDADAMSRSARIIAEFGGEEREFCLRIGELMELEEKRDAGAAVLLARLSFSQWRVADVVETIRYGLIGGGLDATTASRLVRQFVEQRTYDLGGENGLAVLAVKILAAGTHGHDEEPPGKAAGEVPNGSTTSLTERPAGDQSSAMPS
jgi:hypothetical protein